MNNLYDPKPLLFVISGFSGVGKDTVVNAVKEQKNDLHFVVTATSRPPREGEKDGVDYIFVSEEKFREMIENDEFIEYAVVYNQYKGVPKSQIQEAFDAGKDVIMRLDVQGAAKMRLLFTEAILIFLLPDSTEVWSRRLEERNSETEDSMLTRIEASRYEIARIPEFDYQVVNPRGRVDKAVNAIASIIEVKHCRVMHREINNVFETERN